MGQHSIRVPDHIDRQIAELAVERQTSYTEVVIWAVRKYLGIEDEFIARQDRRTISGRVPVAEASRLAPVEKEPPPPIPVTVEPAPRYPPLNRRPSRPAFKCPIPRCEFRASSPAAKCGMHGRTVVPA